MSQAGANNTSGGGSGSVLGINVQTGTSPVTPTGGLITFNGATVAAGTNPVRTDGTGASTMALEVQTAQAIAATDATKIGLAAFNSANFTVDANGFVTAIGGGGSTPSLSPYIVGLAGTNDFATIQAAINQAVTDGHTSSSPANVYIKPGTYTEDLALADGVNLVGFDPTNFPSINVGTTVLINGSLTCATAGKTNLYNLTVNSTANPNVQGTGTIGFNGCLLTGTQDCFVDNGINVITATLRDTVINNSGRLFFPTSGGFNLDAYNCSILPGTTASDSAVIFSTFNINNCFWNTTCDTGSNDIFVNWSFINCIINITTTLLNNTGVTSSFFSYFVGNQLGNGADLVQGQGLVVSSFIAGNYSANGPPTGGGNVVRIASNYNASTFFYNTLTGPQGTVFQDSALNTSSDGFKNLYNITLPTNGATTIFCNISGTDLTYVDATGGNIAATILTNSGTASIVGSPITNIFATSTGTFQVAVTGGQLLIQVRRPAGVNYDWKGNLCIQTAV